MDAKLKSEIVDCFERSLDARHENETPYKHWLVDNVLPENVITDFQKLDFECFSYEEGYGRREIYNKHRNYFDVENNQKYASCGAMAEAFQSEDVVKKIEDTLDVKLGGSNLRIEFAQDMDGFWLEPHTDVGAKLFTMLLYLSDEEGHETLGTDIYASKDEHVGRSPFAPNHALIFIPSDKTYHGFEKRPIKGIRKSIIVNYVKPEWRSREELAYPNEPVVGR
ncbi:MAG: hypothetical protein DHS20C08_08800 [Rhodomicrobium sp.]|nr:MAG: hypothetical protein DHS20C08_08800 [Rhodomicrobium sp.]